jgi:pyruvate,orthophosphate dikinase
MKWADQTRTMNVRTNADQPDQSANAIAFGAEGIGLCRTEHMFFGEKRILNVREMILSDTEEGRRKAINKLLPYQRQDFEGIFRVMKGRPVTVRTLDPPLHEFLPHEESEIKETADALGVPVEKVKEKIESLHEFNPMLGFRGCRLGISFPEITEKGKLLGRNDDRIAESCSYRRPNCRSSRVLQFRYKRLNSNYFRFITR